MKFSKSWNPSKKKARRPRYYSDKTYEERRDKMLLEVVKAKSDKERLAIMSGFDVEMNPVQK